MSGERSEKDFDRMEFKRKAQAGQAKLLGAGQTRTRNTFGCAGHRMPSRKLCFLGQRLDERRRSWSNAPMLKSAVASPRAWLLASVGRPLRKVALSLQFIFPPPRPEFQRQHGLCE